jgi:hypothetical protein
MTIQEAKNFLQTNKEKGCICPCCGQNVKIYKHLMNAKKALYLIKIYKATLQGNWCNVMQIAKADNGDYAKLRFWGLIEESKEIPTEDVKSNGLWRITRKGIQFVRGELRIPKYARVYDNRFYGFHDEDDLITIHDALGEKFSYYELMTL